MKRYVSALVAMVMLVVGAAWAEEEELHLLWGIEFGQDLETVQDIIKNEHGLEMICEEFTYSDGNGSNRTTKRLRLSDDNALSMVGYLVSGFVWMQTNASSEKLMIDYGNVYYTAEEASAFFTTVMTALVQEYGEIDYAVLEVYSDGFDAWLNGEQKGTHEICHLSDLDMLSLDLKTLLDTRGYEFDQAYAQIELYIDNIQITYDKYSKDSYSMCIQFFNRIPDDTYTDVFECLEKTH